MAKIKHEVDVVVNADTSKFKNSISDIFKGNVLADIFVGGIKAVGDGLKTLGSNVLDTTTSFEKYNAVLTNALGSQELAKMAMGGLQDLAKNTPYSVDELTNSYQKLVNRGFIPSEKAMISLGNLASSTGKSFNQLTEAFLDAGTGEFERLKEFGIVAKKNGKEVALSFKGQTTTIANTQEELQKYLVGLGNVKGVAGSMDMQAKTIGGAISNLGDVFDMLYLEIGQKLSPVLAPMIRKFSDFVTNVTPLVGQGIEYLIKLFGTDLPNAFKPIIEFLTPVFNSVMNALNTIGGAIFSIVDTWRTGIANMYENSEFFRSFIDTVQGAFVNFGNAVSGVVTFVAGAFKAIVTFFTESKIGIKISEMLIDPIKQAWELISKVFKWIGEGFNWINTKLGFKKVELFSKDTIDTVKNLGDVKDVKVSGSKLDFVADALGNKGGNNGAGGAGSNSPLSKESAMSGSGIKNLTINVEKMVESIYITPAEDPMKIKDKVQMALTQIVLDSKLA